MEQHTHTYIYIHIYIYICMGFTMFRTHILLGAFGFLPKPRPLVVKVARAKAIAALGRSGAQRGVGEMAIG